MHKILWDFKIQMNHLIPARRPDLLVLIIIICHLVDLVVSVNHRVKIKKKQKDRQILEPCKTTKKKNEQKNKIET